MGGVVPPGELKTPRSKTANGQERTPRSRNFTPAVPASADALKGRFLPRPPSAGPRSPAMLTPRLPPKGAPFDSDLIDALKIPVAPAHHKSVTYVEKMLLRKDFKQLSSNTYVARTGAKPSNGRLPQHLQGGEVADSDSAEEATATSESLELLAYSKSLQRSATKAVEEWVLLHFEGFISREKIGFGVSTFVEVLRSRAPVWESVVVTNKKYRQVNPAWGPLLLRVDDLCAGDYTRSVLIRLVAQKPTIGGGRMNFTLGQITMSLAEILNATQKGQATFALHDGDLVKGADSNEGVTPGYLRINKASIMLNTTKLVANTDMRDIISEHSFIRVKLGAYCLPFYSAGGTHTQAFVRVKKKDAIKGQWTTVYTTEILNLHNDDLHITGVWAPFVLRAEKLCSQNWDQSFMLACYAKLDRDKADIKEVGKVFISARELVRSKREKKMPLLQDTASEESNEHQKPNLDRHKSNQQVTQTLKVDARGVRGHRQSLAFVADDLEAFKLLRTKLQGEVAGGDGADGERGQGSANNKSSILIKLRATNCHKRDLYVQISRQRATKWETVAHTAHLVGPEVEWKPLIFDCRDIQIEGNNPDGSKKHDWPVRIEVLNYKNGQKPSIAGEVVLSLNDLTKFADGGSMPRTRFELSGGRRGKDEAAFVIDHARRADKQDIRDARRRQKKAQIQRNGALLLSSAAIFTPIDTIDAEAKQMIEDPQVLARLKSKAGIRMLRWFYLDYLAHNEDVDAVLQHHKSVVSRELQNAAEGKQGGWRRMIEGLRLHIQDKGKKKRGRVGNLILTMQGFVPELHTAMDYSVEDAKELKQQLKKTNQTTKTLTRAAPKSALERLTAIKA